MASLGLNNVSPPPLFSTYVYDPQTDEQKCYDRTLGYREFWSDLQPFMVGDYDFIRAVLVMANSYHIPVTWKRKLEIIVHEARNLAPQSGLFLHDVRCKLVHDTQIERTSIISKVDDGKVAWNETLKFFVDTPQETKLLVYVKNPLIPNDKLGTLFVTPDQMTERETVTAWFPLNTTGDVKLSLTLSTPYVSSFKFFIPTPITLSFRDCHVFDEGRRQLFTMTGKWPSLLSILDHKDFSILTIKNHIFEPTQQVFHIYYSGQGQPALVISKFAQQSGICVEGLAGVTQVSVSTHDRSMRFFAGKSCLASADVTKVGIHKGYAVEIRAGPDLLLFLGTIVTIAKLF